MKFLIVFLYRINFNNTMCHNWSCMEIRRKIRKAICADNTSLKGSQSKNILFRYKLSRDKISK